MGLIAGQDLPQPPNNAPEWVSSVLTTFTAGTGGTHNLNTNTADIEGDTLSYSLFVDGTSLVANGDFAVDAGWTKGTGWTIGSGVASHAAGTASDISQIAPVGPIVEGDYHRVQFDVINRTAGSVTPVVGGTSGTAVSADATNIQQTILAGGSPIGVLAFSATSDFDGDIDNVSIVVVSAPLPSGVSLASNGIITVTAGASAGVTSGILINVSDGTAADVISPSLTLTIEDASAFTNYDYPRIAQYLIGGVAQNQYGESAFQTSIAQVDLAVLNSYPGFSDNGQNLTQIVSGIKAVDSTTSVFFYVEPAAFVNATAWNAVYTKIEAETGPGGNSPDWWAYKGDGSRVGWYSGPPPWSVNITENVTADSNGDYFPEWYAQYFFDTIVDGTGADGIFHDNINPKPVASADWNGDNVTDDSNDATVKANWQTGKKNFTTAFRTASGIDLAIGNATQNWLITMPTPYDQVFSGMLMEHAIGEFWSIEGTDHDGTINAWGSWAAMMTAYSNFMAASIAPKWCILEMKGLINDYDFMRYGLCSTLMDNGFFSFDEHGSIYTKVCWFDEFDYNLGQPVDDPQTSAYESGVYLREFDNGLAVVNPRTNGQQTITLPSAGAGFHWELLNAADYENQDPAVNTGATVTQITINESDGRIIKRVAD